MSPPKPNIDKVDTKALGQVKSDNNRIILTVNKGVGMVVMNRQEYLQKAKNLLEHPNTNRPILLDPINKYKAKLISILRKFKAETGIEYNTYKRMHQTGFSFPMFYGLPKIHRTSPRPIFASRGLGRYGIAQELAGILGLLVGKSIHHVINTEEFVEHMKNIKLGTGECIMSYDVPVISTSVQVETGIEIIKHKLEQDKELQKRTIMSVNHVIQLLGFCLNNTHFLFQGKLYEQI